MAYRLRMSRADPMSNLQQRIADLRQHLERTKSAHPNVFLAATIIAFTVTLATVGGSLWLAYDVFHDLPSTSELRSVGAMAQATTLYDRNNEPAFTIYQERRIETPLANVSPNLVRAIIAKHGELSPKVGELQRLVIV